MSVKVGLVGIGNCASALIQGVSYYTEYPDAPGLIRRDINGLKVSDIEFSVGFDVDPEKVNASLSRATQMGDNNTWDMGVPMPPSADDAIVHAGPVMDSMGNQYRDSFQERAGGVPIGTGPDVQRFARIVKEAGTDVLVNYLPVGSEDATRFWADVCLEAKVAMVNAIPVFLASGEYGEAFREAGVPILGDDIKSQYGATILHRILTRLLADRGFSLSDTYQLNFGGNMDFRNMKDQERLGSKKVSKTNAVMAEYELPADRVHIGPSDYVPWLTDQKWCYINMQIQGFGGAPGELELKLKVWDSPNSAGVVADCVRLANVADKMGQGGPWEPACAQYFKTPPVQIPDDVAAERLEEQLASSWRAVGV